MLKDRVGRLIGQFHGGVVYAAAKDWGVPMQTLYRIASGETPNPRAAVLAKIAASCDTTVEWLLTGAGAGPVTMGPGGVRVEASFLRWYRLVGSLSLDPKVAFALLDLSFTRMNAARLLHSAFEGPTAGLSEGEVDAINRTEFEFWAGLLAPYVKKHGAERVATVLAEQGVKLTVGYNATAIHLTRDPKIGPAFEGAVHSALLQRIEAAGKMSEATGEAPVLPRTKPTAAGKQGWRRRR